MSVLIFRSQTATVVAACSVALLILVILCDHYYNIDHVMYQSAPQEAVAVPLKTTDVRKDYSSANISPSSDKEYTDTATWMNIQRARRELITDTCKKYPGDEDLNKLINRRAKGGVFFQFIVDDLHKVLYCSIPKSGCTSWHATILQLRAGVKLNGKGVMSRVHDLNYMQRHGLKRLNFYTDDEVRHRLETYTKFLFVRHPFERLASAYHDKIKNGGILKGQKALADRARSYRKDPQAKHSVKTEFVEFIDMMADESLKQKWDPHWSPVQDLCFPCVVHFDYVGHMDTMNDDADHVLREVFNNTAIKFPRYHARKGNSYASDYEAIDKETLHRVYELYRKDFEMFNYD